MTLKHVLAALGIFAAAAFLVAWGSGKLDGGSSGSTGFEARIPPVEFLYLDGGRILNYVAQLEGGEVGEVHRISKEISTVSGEAATGGFKVGASSQHENEADSTLTRTESSELGLLLNDLRGDHLPGVSLHAVSLEDPAGLRGLREGWLVRFSTDHLLAPGYIRPYVVVRQSATLAALFPQAAGSEASALRAAEQRVQNTPQPAAAILTGADDHRQMPRLVWLSGGIGGRAVRHAAPPQYPYPHRDRRCPAGPESCARALPSSRLRDSSRDRSR